MSIVSFLCEVFTARRYANSALGCHAIHVSRPSNVYLCRSGTMHRDHIGWNRSTSKIISRLNG